MTIDDIKNLVSADESRTLELKKTTGELKDGMHSACAFLNTEGGWLIFGIAPKSLKIIGQEVTDKTQQEMAQAVAGLEPAVPEVQAGAVQPLGVFLGKDRGGEHLSGLPRRLQGLRQAAHGRSACRGGSSSSSKLRIYTSQNPRMAASSWAKKPS